MQQAVEMKLAFEVKTGFVFGLSHDQNENENILEWARACCS